MKHVVCRLGSGYSLVGSRPVHAYIKPSARVRWAFPTDCYVPGTIPRRSFAEPGESSKLQQQQRLQIQEGSARYDAGGRSTQRRCSDLIERSAREAGCWLRRDQ